MFAHRLTTSCGDGCGSTLLVSAALLVYCAGYGSCLTIETSASASSHSTVILVQRDAVSLKGVSRSASVLRKDSNLSITSNTSAMWTSAQEEGIANVPPVMHRIRAQDEELPSLYQVHQTPHDAEYQCASQLSTNNTCTCDGFVKFGFGSKWSQWKNVSGNISCDTTQFTDPILPNGGVCMCLPRVYTCATEWSTPIANCTECTMQDQCLCLGSVRMGYGDNWTAWTAAAGSTTCRVSSFGSDPYDGHGKICQCQPSFDMLQQMSNPSGAGVVLNCISAVVLVYFASISLYTLLGSSDGSILHQTLETWVATMRLAPMMCAVFLAVVKRSATLTAETPELYWLPQPYLKISVVLCAATFIAQSAFYAYAENCAQREALMNQVPDRLQAQSTILSTLADFSLTLMYLALIVTLVGTVFMVEPQSLNQVTGKTPVAPGTVCTILLAAVYFAVYLALHVIRNSQEPGHSQSSGYEQELVRVASTTLNIAPMVSALFLAVQVAADWQSVLLPRRVEVCLYICVASLLVQVVLVVVSPAFSTSFRSNDASSRADFVVVSPQTYRIVSFIRWVAVSALYAGVGVTVVSLWTLKLVPRLTHMLIVLIGAFFAVYTALWILATIRQLSRSGFLRAIHVLGIAKEAAMLCPMLAILILGSWVHAHQMSNVLGEPGEPQGWVQDYMRVAVGAIVVMLLLIIVRGLSSELPAGMELNSEVMSKESFSGALAVFLPMAVVCFSAVLVIVGLFSITPETATSEGAWLG